jgi:hypothetical protein
MGGGASGSAGGRRFWLSVVSLLARITTASGGPP